MSEFKNNEKKIVDAERKTNDGEHAQTDSPGDEPVSTDTRTLSESVADNRDQRQPFAEESVESFKQTMFGRTAPEPPALHEPPPDEADTNRVRITEKHDRNISPRTSEAITREVAQQLKEFFQIGQEKPTPVATPPIPHRSLLTNDLIESFDFGFTGDIVSDGSSADEVSGDFHESWSSESPFPDPVNAPADASSPADNSQAQIKIDVAVPEGIDARAHLPSVMELEMEMDTDFEVEISHEPYAIAPGDEVLPPLTPLIRDAPVEIAPSAVMGGETIDTAEEESPLENLDEDMDDWETHSGESVHKATAAADDDDTPSVTDFLLPEAGNTIPAVDADSPNTSATVPSLRAVRETAEEIEAARTPKANRPENAASTSSPLSNDVFKKVAGFLLGAAAVAAIGVLILRNSPGPDSPDLAEGPSPKKIARTGAADVDRSEKPVPVSDAPPAAPPLMKRVEESVRVVDVGDTDVPALAQPPFPASALAQPPSPASALAQPSSPASAASQIPDVPTTTLAADATAAGTVKKAAISPPAKPATGTPVEPMGADADMVIFPARFKTGTAVFCFLDKAEEKAWVRDVREKSNGKQILVQGYVTREEKQNRLGRIAISRAWAVQKYLQRRGFQPEIIQAQRGKIKNWSTLPEERTEVVRLSFPEPSPPEDK